MRILIAVLIVIAVCEAHSLAAEALLTTLSCGTHTMSAGERVAIQSPNFPRKYKNDYRCQYEITCNAMASTYLEFICPVFQLESSRDCSADRLIVKYHKGRLQKCGTDSPHGIKTIDGWTRLTFFTNSQNNAKGFRCYIWCREQIASSSSAATSAATTAVTTSATTPAAASTSAAATFAATTSATTSAAATTTVSSTTTAPPTPI